MSSNEHHALNFFITQLGQKLRADEIIETEIRRLVETRHAVRSGLNGLSHLEEAITCFEIIADKNYKDPPEVLLRRAYKSIRRTSLFAHKTRSLMEQSRYMLTDITSSSLRLEEFSITTLVKQVHLCLSPEAEHKRIIVDVDSPILQPFDKIYNDPLLIEILVFNILDNAIKYSSSEKHIRVKTFLRGPEWCLEVTNEGPWISTEERSAIFLPFQRRVKGRWAQSTIGTGVGLTVAKKIVSAHNGRIDVNSKPLSEKFHSPAETIFFVTLPRKITTSSTS